MRTDMNDSIYVYDAESGEETIIELTDEQQAELNSQREIAITQRQTELDAVRLAWETKIGAYRKLGLSAEEIEIIAPMPFELKA